MCRAHPKMALTSTPAICIPTYVHVDGEAVTTYGVILQRPGDLDLLGSVVTEPLSPVAGVMCPCGPGGEAAGGTQASRAAGGLLSPQLSSAPAHMGPMLQAPAAQSSLWVGAMEAVWSLPGSQLHWIDPKP